MLAACFLTSSRDKSPRCGRTWVSGGQGSWGRGWNRRRGRVRPPTPSTPPLLHPGLPRPGTTRTAPHCSRSPGEATGCPVQSRQLPTAGLRPPGPRDQGQSAQRRPTCHRGLQHATGGPSDGWWAALQNAGTQDGRQHGSERGSPRAAPGPGAAHRVSLTPTRPALPGRGRHPPPPQRDGGWHPRTRRRQGAELDLEPRPASRRHAQGPLGSSGHFRLECGCPGLSGGPEEAGTAQAEQGLGLSRRKHR